MSTIVNAPILTPPGGVVPTFVGATYSNNPSAGVAYPAGSQVGDHAFYVQVANGIAILASGYSGGTYGAPNAYSGGGYGDKVLASGDISGGISNVNNGTVLVVVYRDVVAAVGPIFNLNPDVNEDGVQDNPTTFTVNYTKGVNDLVEMSMFLASALGTPPGTFTPAWTTEASGSFYLVQDILASSFINAHNYDTSFVNGAIKDVMLTWKLR